MDLYMKKFFNALKVNLNMSTIMLCGLYSLVVILCNLKTSVGDNDSTSYSKNGYECHSLLWTFVKPSTCPVVLKDSELLYQVIIDAGSTGSRIHIFKFRQTSGGIKLENSEFEEIEPGLSFYPTKPKEGVYSVNGLLKKAQNVVPKDQWKFTPISLRATAGLRLLPDVDAHNIIEEVRKLLMVSPFKKIDSDFISIMDGYDEGIFAWTTLNFLAGNLMKSSGETLGALDLGGGSTQIVFKPVSKETYLSSPQTHVNTVKILGAEHNLYSYSYLGLGLMSARQAVLDFTTLHNNTNTSSSPCIFPSYEGSWAFSGRNFLVRGNRTFSYENCLHYIKQIVTNVHRPAEIIERRFFAFSYFHDIAIALGLVGHDNGGLLTLESYITAAKKACSIDENLNKKSPFLCLDAVYITTLLKQGYGFRDSQHIQIARKINNIEISWALGAALHMLDNNGM